jgi:type IV pilus assembly protein PilN
MIRINLLAPERPAAKKKAAAAAPGVMQAYLFLVLFVGGAVLVCLLGWWLKHSEIADLDSKIAAAKVEQARLQSVKAQVDQLEKQRSTLKQKTDLIEKLKLQQADAVHLLDETSKALPEFVWLTNLDQSGEAVKFTGESNSLNAVADYISNLEKTGWFPDVNLTSSQESSSVVTFNLQAAFKNPEVAAKEKAAAMASPLPGAAPAPVRR